MTVFCPELPRMNTLGFGFSPASCSVMPNCRQTHMASFYQSGITDCMDGDRDAKKICGMRMGMNLWGQAGREKINRNGWEEEIIHGYMVAIIYFTMSFSTIHPSSIQQLSVLR